MSTPSASVGTHNSSHRNTARGWPNHIGRRTLRLASPKVVVPAAIIVVLGALWWPFAASTGMSWDTTLVYASETDSFWDGFFYNGDPLRVYTSVFYQVGYEISQLLGIRGDYLGYYIIYGVLWFGRGVLTYLILRRLFPRFALFPFLVAILVLVHASDHALKMIGQINQFGMIFWMLLALYLLVVAMTTTGRKRRWAFLLGSAIAAYLCLWSYESPLFLLFVVPLLFVAAVPDRRRGMITVGVFYLVPLWYVVRNVQRYVDGSGTTYQESVARASWHPSQLLSDLIFNMRASLEFWNWGEWASAPRAPDTALALATVAALTVLAAGAALIHQARSENSPRFPTLHTSAALLLAGAVVLVAAFPAYLALAETRQLWRTQFLSGIGAAIVIASALALGSSFIRSTTARMALVTIGVAVVTFFGTTAAYRASQYQHDVWEPQRRVMAAILHSAPRVEPGTVVLLTGIRRSADPFGHNMWFDYALRLAYPGIPVAGVYFYDTGAPSPGNNMKIVGDQWKQIAAGVPTLIRQTPLSHTVVVQVDADGRGHLRALLPSSVAATRQVVDSSAVIRRSEPSPLARRRYELGP
jgi:hypothetical protein